MGDMKRGKAFLHIHFMTGFLVVLNVHYHAHRYIIIIKNMQSETLFLKIGAAFLQIHWIKLTNISFGFKKNTYVLKN